ncbi:MAG: helix-turn-helix domain-containing protein [Erysipelotrichaceae bacterium]
MIEIKIKQLLKEKNMSSKQLAEQLEMTEANMSILVSGKAKAIRFSTLEALCKTLDCTVADILSYTSE